ncbi:MAG: PAS domain S-box protein [Chloroflexi bacterium]|nr:PAS domain S-box protein [Chloroflexota bacterium]
MARLSLRRAVGRMTHEFPVSGRFTRDRGFRALIEHSSDLIAVVDAQGTIVYASPSTAPILGYSDAELVGRSAFEFIHPDDQEHTKAALRAVVSTPGDRVQAVYRVRHQNGSWRWMEATGTNLLAEPHVRGVVANYRDVTEQVESRQRRESILKVARRFAAEADPMHVLGSLLEESVRLVGGDAGTVYRWDSSRESLVPVENTLSTAMECTPIRPGQGASGQAFSQRAPVIFNDYQRQENVLTAAVKAGVQAAIAAPLRDSGTLLGVIGVTSYQPEKRFNQLDAELLELVAALGAATLVALERARLEGVRLATRTAEHELNNPLAITGGYAELLAADPTLPSHLRSAAEEALAGVHAAADRLRKLQRISRIELKDWGSPVRSTIDLAHSLPC